MDKKYAIIDFETTEVVRGSFGYDGYLLYSDMKNKAKNVDFFEDATPYKLHKVEKQYDKVFLHLWSYPQLNNIQWYLYNYGDKNVEFIGYKPLIEKLGYKINSKYWNNTVIYNGMKHLPKIFDDMKYGLLSDCDLHIKSTDTRRVFPLFMSYGCPNNCSFCPIPANRKCYKEKRIELSFDDAKYTIATLLREKDCNIHFIDEDFFMNVEKSHKIIKFLLKEQKKNERHEMLHFKWIALASVPTFYAYLKRFNEDYLLKSNCHLVEIGIEASDVSLRKKMNKTGNEEQINFILKKSQNIEKFWLSVTLFPGETITTLNEIGIWLAKHGTKPDNFGNRLITNGNVGGLGQFFQLYDGVNKFDNLKKSGLTLEKQPIRLLPSFLPLSFLNSKIKQIRKMHKVDKVWFGTYNLDLNKYKNIKIKKGDTIRQIINRYLDKQIEKSYNPKLERFVVYLCLLARLNIIK